MTDSHSALHTRVRTLRPTGDEAKLEPGCIFIAILKAHKRSTEVLEHSDILWKKCQLTDKLAATYEAYLKDSKLTGELGLQFDGKTVTSTTIVGDLNWRKDDFIVLEAVMELELTTETEIGASESQTGRTITQKSVSTPQTITATSVESSTSKMAPTQPQPSQDVPVKSNSVPSDMEGRPSEKLLNQSLSDRAWLDFLCDRRACLRIQRPPTAAAEVVEMDGRISREFTLLGPVEKQCYDQRALQIGEVLGEEISTRCAFW